MKLFSLIRRLVWIAIKYRTNLVVQLLIDDGKCQTQAHANDIAVSVKHKELVIMYERIK